MKIILYVSSILLMGLLFQSCKKLGLCKEDELSITRQDYTGNQLRTDGYFYEETHDTSGEYSMVKFFYRNGINSGLGSVETEKAKTGNLNFQVYIDAGNKSGLGTFRISGNIIETEVWAPSPDGCFVTKYDKGEILNDTTFIINRSEYRRNGKVRRVDNSQLIYMFHASKEKPDSTNSYIK